MSRRGRAAKVTFSVAIDPELKAALVARAKQLYGGNMSELVAEMGREALRLAALERYLERHGGSKLTEKTRAEVLAEVAEGWRHAREHAEGSRPRRQRASR